MKITDEELLEIIEDVTVTLGQILLSHRELTEGLLDQNQTDRSQDKIDTLKKRVEAEKEKLTRHRHHQQRSKELERIRKSHEKEKQTEGKSPSHLVTIRDQRGRVVGFLQSVGKNKLNVLNQRGRLVGRFVNGQTFDQTGKTVGMGDQLLRVLGQTLKKVSS